MKKIWLDDERDPPDDTWEWVKTAGACIAAIKSAQREETLVSLDHDLGERQATGYDVLKWLEVAVFEKRSFICPYISVHTANPPARERMNAAIGSIETYLRRSLSPGS